MPYELQFYTRSNGRKPVQEFLSSLEKRNPFLAAKVLQGLDLLESYGHQVSMPYVKYLEDGIYELRSKASGGISRVFYFFFDGNKIVLTHGFVKKTQKTPSEELQKAKRYKKDYEENHE
ncbi:MAG: type II toxin-antitoxin system RelE/ParE family toxin [Planctomycetia bacterium]|nr:type II toxin-antitoxin system RelE/ParE family toxin [Planctomycetia bacterium]